MTNVEIRVRGAYDRLSNTEKKIADFFLQNTDTIFQTPIAQLAEQSGVSQVAWVRFCKDIGFTGLKDMKNSLFAELNEAMADSGRHSSYEFTDIKNFSTVDQIAENVKHSSMQAIEDTVRLLDFETVGTVVQKLIGAKTIQLFGVGASSQVAEDFYSKLIRIGKSVVYDRDLHFQLTYAANLTPNDVAIFVSNSGLTKELLDVLAVARESEATCVAVTRYARSPLSEACDYCLYTSAPEVDKRSGAMSSRIAQLVVMDILFTAMANQDYFNVESMLERSYEVCLGHRVRP